MRCLLCKDRQMTQGRGPVRGKPQAHRRVSYDPSTGEPWRTGVVVPAEEAAKAITAATTAGLSFAGLVTELIRRMAVDDATGRPVWTDELAQYQKELPQAG
jgi:hypothetical protein